MVDRVEPRGATNAAYQTSRLRLRFASRTSTDWNWRNGDDWRCRSRHTRGPSSLHARCYAALFRIRFGRVANDEVHDGQEGTVESGVPRRDGTKGLPSRLSALQILHAWSLPLLRRGSVAGRQSPTRVIEGLCPPLGIALPASEELLSGGNLAMWVFIPRELMSAMGCVAFVWTVAQRPEHMLKYCTGLQLVGFGQAFPDRSNHFAHEQRRQSGWGCAFHRVQCASVVVL